MPNTAHEIAIGFGSTPPRLIGWLLTGFGALTLAGRLLGVGSFWLSAERDPVSV
jgi:hypothetical protein